MTETDFRIGPRLGELGALGRTAARSLSPAGRRRDAERWAQAGLEPAHHLFRQVASAATDEVFLNVVRAMTAKPARRDIGRVLEETAAAVDVYRAAGWLKSPKKLHGPAVAMDPEITTVNLGGRDWERLADTVVWAPPKKSPGAQRWLDYPSGNGLAYVLRHKERRPWLVMTHGAYMGDLKVNCKIFDVVGLHYKLGLNIAMPILPLHGERKLGSVAKSLPNLDTMDNIHGLMQAAAEVRGLIAWIRQQDPAAKVGLYGVSLGGYVASLSAGLEGPLDLLVAGVPAVDFPAVFHSQTPQRIKDSSWYQEFHAQVVALNKPISPLSVMPATPFENRFLYAARGDRVLPPRAQALRLWEHWGRPQSMFFDGAHVVQVKSKPVRRFVEDAATATLL